MRAGLSRISTTPPFSRRGRLQGGDERLDLLCDRSTLTQLSARVAFGALLVSRELACRSHILISVLAREHQIGAGPRSGDCRDCVRADDTAERQISVGIGCVALGTRVRVLGNARQVALAPVVGNRLRHGNDETAVLVTHNILQVRTVQCYNIITFSNK